MSGIEQTVVFMTAIITAGFVGVVWAIVWGDRPRKGGR